MSQSVRQYWTGLHGRARLNFNWDAINRDSVVLISASEFSPDGADPKHSPRFVGAASLRVSNISPHGPPDDPNRGVTFVVTVDFPTPINVVTDITVLDAPPTVVTAQNAVDHGGRLLTDCKIVLVFRGSGWTAGIPQSSEAAQMMDAVLASPYMSRLAQYRGIQNARVVASLTDTSDVGSLGPDPRGYLPTDVWRISGSQVEDMVRAAAAAHPPEATGDTLYLIAYSHDPLPVFADPSTMNAGGFHQHMAGPAGTLVYGIGLNWSGNTADNVWNSTMSLPAVLTHELVEACTDPEGNGILLGDGGDEICDLGGTVRSVRVNGFAKDITLAAYWSEQDGMPVVPTS